MQYTLMLWHADHVNFGRLLNLLESELQLAHDRGTADYDLMLDIMHYMLHYSDTLHHPQGGYRVCAYQVLRRQRRGDDRRAD